MRLIYNILHNKYFNLLKIESSNNMTYAIFQIVWVYKNVGFEIYTVWIIESENNFQKYNLDCLPNTLNESENIK